MRFKWFRRYGKRYFSRGLFIKVSILVIFLLTINWAISREDGSGNTIDRDLIAPAGAGMINDGSSNVITCAIGQTCVGLSQRGGGSVLIHGVFYPEEIAAPTETTGYLIY